MGVSVNSRTGGSYPGSRNRPAEGTGPVHMAQPRAQDSGIRVAELASRAGTREFGRSKRGEIAMSAIFKANMLLEIKAVRSDLRDLS